MTDPKHEPVAYRFKHEHLPDEWKYATHSPKSRPWHNTEGLYSASTVEALTAQLDALKAENAALLSRVETDRQNHVGQGMVIAAGIIMSCWGEEVMATEILGAAGFHSKADLRAVGVEDYDIDLVKPALRARAALQETKP